MGAFNPISGVTGSVTVNSVAYCFGKWDVSVESNLPDVSNFCGGGYRQVVVGLRKATLTLEGPYDGGNMPICVATAYNFVLNWNNTLNIVLPAIVSKIDESLDINGAGMIKLTAESNGTFTSCLV